MLLSGGQTEDEEEVAEPSRSVGNRQGDRGVPVAVTLKPKLREILARAAADQFRAVSAQATKYIVDGLIADGYIRVAGEPVDLADVTGLPEHE